MQLIRSQFDAPKLRFREFGVEFGQQLQTNSTNILYIVDTTMVFSFRLQI